MLHRTAPFRSSPDEITKAELDSIGLGDPAAALRRETMRDVRILIIVFLVAFLFAAYFDIGDWYRDASIKYEIWEFDEIAIAILLSAIAFCSFAWRQWKRYEAEMRRRLKLEEDLVEMRVMADHLGDNKALFLANLAHDFRTPLNGILGFSQLMNEMPYEALDAKRFKSYIQTIYESAQMLNERIETCLDPEKIDFGAEPMQMIAYPLKNAVNAAMPIVQGLAQSANIKLIDDVSNDLPCVHADGRALKKIIVNLVTNAIKHSRPRGTVKISAWVAESRDLIVTIEDNGVGMDPRMLAALDEGKRPEPPSEDATMASTGIGLFVVKRLLNLHQATLAFDTSPTGTTATIIFPTSRVIPAKNA